LPAAWSSGVAQVEIVIIAWVGVTPGRPGTAAFCWASSAGLRNEIVIVRFTT
jgi:hypothetical protein